MTDPTPTEHPTTDRSAVVAGAAERGATRGAPALGPGAPAEQGAPACAEAGAPDRRCDWCGGPIPPEARRDSEVCGVVCRKRRWRFRQAVLRRSTRDASRVATAINDASPARFAYADPPYPGKAGYYIENTEVDHRSLIRHLEAEFPDGWALSTSAAALRDVLCMCPAGARVCVWRRRVRYTRSSRPLSAWEPLIITGGRLLDTSRTQHVVDDLVTDDVELDDVLDYRGRYDSFPGALTGMKPPEFAAWLFAQLGARPGDELVDLYPGSGAISRAWRLYTSMMATQDASRVDAGRAA